MSCARTILVLLPLAAMCALVGCQFSARGQNTAGVQRFQAGDYPSAATHFQKALSFDPRNADAHYNLGALLHRYAETNKDANSLTQAEREYQLALQLDPNHADARRAHTVLLTQTNRASEAYASLRQWAERNPASAEPRVELARLYQESGDKRSAEELLTQALQLDPNNARAYAAIGHLRELNGEYSAALANYQKAVAIKPTLVAERQKVYDLQSRGVNALPLQPAATPGAIPLAPGPAASPRMVNAPGPMRRF